MLKIYVVVMSVVVFFLAFAEAHADGVDLVANVIVSLLIVVVGLLSGGLISSPRWIPAKEPGQLGRYVSGALGACSVTMTLLAIYLIAELSQSPF